ncbi:MAG: primase [Bacteroidetes bacterium]|nr:primase [Bacteroidota bacterium]
MIRWESTSTLLKRPSTTKAGISTDSSRRERRFGRRNSSFSWKDTPIVEGYADLISVYQAGIQNIVASSGTALTEEQIQLIGRYTKTITLVYDADSAGSKATMRGVDLIIEQGLEVKVAELPQGEDPDSFVKKHGGEAFQKLLDDAASFLDFKVRSFQSEGLLSTPDGQARAVRSIVETIAKMKDELKRTFYIKSVSEKYRIYESVLYGELDRILGRERTRAQFTQRKETAPALDETKTEQVYVPPAKELLSVERDLLKLMLEHGNEMVGFVFSHIERESFTHPLAQRLVQIILQHAESGVAWDANTLIGEVDDADFRRFVASLVFSKYEISKGWGERGSAPEEPDPGDIAERCFLIVRRQQLDEMLKENQQKMKDAAARGESAREYLERHHALLNEKKELEKGTAKKVTL